ncbi:MAG: Na+:solute symporter [Prolixibacteraceae bacterium]|nr:Na+:solute symporter [Prolixibacteraceae bacterium]MBN2648188.1 Na+:solute symporter [Prolixibacteraceae bacterium]
MHLSFIDWAIVFAYLVVSMGIGVYMSRRAGRSTDDFFLSGRKLPWYIAGTSMVATTFAADTPLAVSELVAQNGIAGNWLWWNMLFGGMLTVFFFARLWRRADILTDTEFVKIRYSGSEARFLRGFRAVYIGVVMNTVVIAWVNLAMVKILEVMFPELTFFGQSKFEVLGITFSSHLVMVALLMVFVAIYSALSGLWGVSITDSFQFVMAMGGSIVLAVFAVRQVGGIEQVKEQLSSVPWVFDFFPEVGRGEVSGRGGLLKMSVVAFVAYLGVQWWASWYPGAEPGGGGYVAQRMMSAKDEKHSLLATLWFQVAHYAVRPWPWILVALCALILYPNEADKGATYVMMIRDLMPAGLLGLLLAAFFAAYMSTIASQTVWGTSYIVNDLFRPFVKKNASERYYVRVSRITTFLLMLFSLIVTTQFSRISDAWKFVLACSGGIGLVLLLRWFWWRINAWSELAAMVAPYIIYPILKYKYQLDFETSLILIVVWSTLVWLLVTLLTPPTHMDTLKSFYAKVHPGGIGWKPVAVQMPGVKGDTGYGRLFANWILGCILVLLALFGTGKIIFKEYQSGIIYLVLAIVVVSGGIVLNRKSNIW